MVHSATGVKPVQVYHKGQSLDLFLSIFYINDLFLMVTDTTICNFVDDMTIFTADSCLEKVLERLETDALVLSKWFPENLTKLNEASVIC